MQTNWTNLGLWNRSMRLLAIWHETKIGQPQSSKFIFLLFLQFISLIFDRDSRSYKWQFYPIGGVVIVLPYLNFRAKNLEFTSAILANIWCAKIHNRGSASGKYFQSCFNNKASTIQDHLLHFLNFRILLFWSTFVSSVPFGLANQLFFPKCFSSFQQKHFFLNFHHSSPSSLGNTGKFL